MNYIYNRKNWPKLTWSQERLAGQLAGVRHRQGRLIGRMEGLGFSLRSEAVLQTLTEDVLKSSEIEGEKLDKDQVRSSIARRLGLDIGGLILNTPVGVVNDSLRGITMCSGHPESFQTKRCIDV